LILLCTSRLILCSLVLFLFVVFFFSSRRRHTRSKRDWSSDVCSSDLWCERRDSNSHTSRRQNLNLVRLPIPPRSQGQVKKGLYKSKFKKSSKQAASLTS